VYRITWVKKKSKGKIRYYAYFRSYVLTEKEEDLEKEKTSSIDIKVPVSNPSEILAIAKMLGCEVTNSMSWVRIGTEDAYFRLIVYAVARMSIKKPAKVDELKSLVVSEGFSTDAWWWANTFINRYKNEGAIKGIGARCLYKPARAFKLVYNLD
jgi:hypothetical protein